MRLYMLLVLFPIGFGIYALLKNKLPVSGKRSLTGEDAQRYGKWFILFPLCVVGAALLLIACDRFLYDSRLIRETAFYIFAVGLLLGLAIILDRARKRARREMRTRKEWMANLLQLCTWSRSS